MDNSYFVTARVVYDFDKSRLPAGSLVKITVPRDDEDWNGFIPSTLADRLDEELEPQIKTVTVGGVVEWNDDGDLLVRVPMDGISSTPGIFISAEDVHNGAAKIELLWRNDL